MIAFTTDPHAQRFVRTIRWVQDAQGAIDRGEFTVAVLLIRTAVGSARSELLGRQSANQGLFAYSKAMEAGVSRGTIRRIRRFQKQANAVAHGCRDGKRRDAERMLILFQAIAARWIQRQPVPEPTPEELTTV